MALLRQRNLATGVPGRWPRRIAMRHAGPESVTPSGRPESVTPAGADPYFSRKKRKHPDTISQDVPAIMARIRRWLQSGCQPQFYPSMRHAGPES